MRRPHCHSMTTTERSDRTITPETITFDKHAAYPPALFPNAGEKRWTSKTPVWTALSAQEENSC